MSCCRSPDGGVISSCYDFQIISEYEFKKKPKTFFSLLSILIKTKENSRSCSRESSLWHLQPGLTSTSDNHFQNCQNGCERLIFFSSHLLFTLRNGKTMTVLQSPEVPHRDKSISSNTDSMDQVKEWTLLIYFHQCKETDHFIAATCRGDISDFVV